MEGTSSKRESVVNIGESRGEGTSYAGVVETVAVFLSVVLMIITLPFSIFFCFRIVSEFQRAVIFRLGRMMCVESFDNNGTRSGEARGPGVFFILPCVDDIRIVDLRTVTCVINPQEILTKDSVTVSVDAVVYHRVSNPMRAVIKVADYYSSTSLLAASTLRNVLGTINLSELLTERESIAGVIKNTLDQATDPWGIVVERVEIKDVSLPVQLQRAMAAEAEASREARAKIIAAEGEKKASQSLKEASDVISQSGAALQLRYLQTLNNIAQEKNSTIVFPVPVEIMRGFFGNTDNKC